MHLTRPSRLSVSYRRMRVQRESPGWALTSHTPPGIFWNTPTGRSRLAIPFRSRQHKDESLLGRDRTPPRRITFQFATTGGIASLSEWPASVACIIPRISCDIQLDFGAVADCPFEGTSALSTGSSTSSTFISLPL